MCVVTDSSVSRIDSVRVGVVVFSSAEWIILD